MAITIKQLDASVVKILCSSQVITSPSSVIKELLENALDANATNIDVKLESFGLDRIEVRDNGSGVKAEDAKYMTAANYTSKLCDYSDLERIKSYGFRGEALSAIANIGDISIATKCADEEIGTLYRYDHCGNVVSQSPCAMNQGTCVVVTKLFKNLPVRRQYYTSMDKRKEEIKRVEILLKSYGIIRYGVHFSLYHDKNLTWRKGRSSDLKSSLLQVFGIALMKCMEMIQYRSTDCKIQISAYLPKRKTDVQLMGRSQPDMTYVYVNERPVTLKYITQILRKGYSTGHELSGSQMRYPVACVCIEVPTETVDVNIDPNKTQVYLHAKEDVINALNSLVENLYEITPAAQINSSQTMNKSSISEVEKDNYSQNQNSKIGINGLMNINQNHVTDSESTGHVPRVFDELDENFGQDSEIKWKIFMDYPETECQNENGIVQKPSNPGAEPDTLIEPSRPEMRHKFSDQITPSQWSKGRIRNSSGKVIKPPQLLVGRRNEQLLEIRPELEIIECPMKKQRFDTQTSTLDSFLHSTPLTAQCRDPQNVQPNKKANTGNSKLEKRTKSASQKLQCIGGKNRNKLSSYQKSPVLAVAEKIRPEIKSVNMPFNLEQIKQNLALSQNNSFTATSTSSESDSTSGTGGIKLVGKLDNGFWVVLREKQLEIVNHHRFSETVLYRRLMDNHIISKHPLPSPIVLKQSNLGEKEWNVLLCMCVTDNRIVQNGFGIQRINEFDGTKMYLAEVADRISFYGTEDLKECLTKITNDPSVPLSQCRPLKVTYYLKGEANRMARAVHNHMSKDELLDLLKTAEESLPTDLNRCLHGLQIFTTIFNMINAPEIMEDE